MTSYLLPLLATAAAFGLTYVFCIRPMRTGRACHAPAPDQPQDAGPDIGALREEVLRLRREVETRTRPADPFPTDDPR